MSSQWWRDAVIYQVYPRSFADSDGDGYGDLPGVISKLEYLATLGVDAVWLSPFYRSPMADAGYDVADYRRVDPLFGSDADIVELIERAHELGLRVIIDLVPNHTSDEHVWFEEALAAEPGSAARERYLFRDGSGPGGDEPPNNWRSVFGGPAWTRVTDPGGAGGQWYLHLFDTKQPDLNWANPEVRAEFEDVLRFWLDRGVDGFRVDVAHSLAKAEGLPDADPEVLEIVDQNQGPAWDQDGVHEIYRRWREIVEGYEHEPVLVAEAWVAPPERLARYVRPDEMHQAFNFDFLMCDWDADAYREVITTTMAANAAVGAPTTWVLSNHDAVRHATRAAREDPTDRHGIGPGDPMPDPVLGLRRARAATLMMLALPGSAYLYQGEELGLPDHVDLEDSVRQDPTFFRTGGEEFGRDGCRIPIPWEADAPGMGFSPSGKTWLPQPDSYRELAVDQQLGVPGSTWAMYHAALALRADYRLGLGELVWNAAAGLDFTVGQVRVIANLGRDATPIPEGYEVLLASAEVTDQVPRDVTVWLRQN